MIKFIKKTVLFLILISGIILIGILIVNYLIDNGNYYKIPSKTDHLIIGNSHTQRALNDTIIRNSTNLSSSAENNLYTYFKIKKIVKHNKIKNIFLSFSNNCVPISYDDYVWKETNLNRSYPKLHAFLGYEEYKIIIRKNPGSFLRIQSFTTKKDIEFLISDNKNAINFYGWGGFDYSKINELDSILQNKDRIPKEEIKNFKYSKYGLEYLDKIVKLCSENKINLFLIRCPVHKSWVKLENEYYFKKILKSKYSNVAFLDFKDFPLDNNSYGDLNHLNHFGASKFSLFFNTLLEDKLLDKQNKQEFINQEMKKLQ